MKNKSISLILIFLFVFPPLSLGEGEGKTQAIAEKASEVLVEELDWIAALSGEPYTGLKCEWFPECKEICKDIYQQSKARSSCNKEHPDTVIELERIDEIFENPTTRNLESIDSSDFAIYVKVGFHPLQNHIDRFNAIESKRVLLWIGKDENIAEVFLKVDSSIKMDSEFEEYNVLKVLLHNLNTDVKKAFERNLDAGDNLIEIIMWADNTEALKWGKWFF